MELAGSPKTQADPAKIPKLWQQAGLDFCQVCTNKFKLLGGCSLVELLRRALSNALAHTLCMEGQTLTIIDKKEKEWFRRETFEPTFVPLLKTMSAASDHW